MKWLASCMFIFGHWQEASSSETSGFEGFGRPWAICKGKVNVSLDELGVAA